MFPSGAGRVKAGTTGHDTGERGESGVVQNNLSEG